MRPTL